MTPSPQVQLRDVVEADLEALYQDQADPEAHRMAEHPPRDRDAFFAHWRQNVLGDPAVVNKAILCDGDLAGYVVCYESDARWTVGYWIHKTHWGRGLATTALRQLITELPQRPLYAWVAKSNVGSRRVVEKCGFVVAREGLGPGAAPGEQVEEYLFELAE